MKGKLKLQKSSRVAFLVYVSLLGFFYMTNMKTSTYFTHYWSNQSHTLFLHVILKKKKMVLIELYKLTGTMLGFESRSPSLNFTLMFVTAGERAQVISTGHHFL